MGPTSTHLTRGAYLVQLFFLTMPPGPAIYSGHSHPAQLFILDTVTRDGGKNICARVGSNPRAAVELRQRAATTPVSCYTTYTDVILSIHNIPVALLTERSAAP